MRTLVIASLAMLLCTGAWAEQKDSPIENPDFDPGFCDVTDWKFMKIDIGVPIPDSDPLGTGLLGPVQVGAAPGELIADIVFDLEIDHTWMGDLIVNTYYDGDCDGVPEVGPVALLCRQQLDACPVDGCCGCSGDLLRGDKYYFGAEGAKEMAADGQCPSVIPHGCYNIALDSPTPLDAYIGLPHDGCFWVEAIDGAGGDLGTVWNFSVHMLNEGGTPVEDATWGVIKSNFQD